MYTRCNLARDQQQPDTLQMLGSIESRIEELIQGLDEAFQQDATFRLPQAHTNTTYSCFLVGRSAERPADQFGTGTLLGVQTASSPLQDEDLVMRLEKLKEGERRERAWV